MMYAQIIPAYAARAIANNVSVRTEISDNIQSLFNDFIPFSKKPNAKYDAADWHTIMSGAAMLRTSVYGFASSIRKYVSAYYDLPPGHRNSPSGQWVCDKCLMVDVNSMNNSFEELTAETVARLRSIGLLKGKCVDVAIDAHLIRRYDKKHGKELIKSKSKGTVGVFERYVTLQCISNGVNIVLAVLPMPALEEMSVFVRRLINICKKVGITIKTVMLDREFFSVDVIRTFNEMGIKYLTPCKNTTNVIHALNEFSTGKRNTKSKMRIAKSKDNYEEYTMIVTTRKKRKKSKKSKKSKKGKNNKNGKNNNDENDKDAPEEVYIGFATNDPSINVERYADRWRIETGYRMVENVRVRTRSRSPVVRSLCFLYSTIMLNFWVIANAILTGNLDYYNGPYSKITQTDIKIIVLMRVLLMCTNAGKPPPYTHCAGCTCNVSSTVMSKPQLPSTPQLSQLPPGQKQLLEYV